MGQKTITVVQRCPTKKFLLPHSPVLRQKSLSCCKNWGKFTRLFHYKKAFRKTSYVHNMWQTAFGLENAALVHLKLRRTKNLTVLTLKQLTTVNLTSLNHDTEKNNRSKLTITLIQIICIISYHFFWQKICIVQSNFTLQYKTI